LKLLQLRCGNLDHETAAAPLASLAAHAAAVTRGDLLDEGEPEADAAGLLGMARQAKERLEDALAHRLGDAGAAIADLDEDEVVPAHRDVAEADLDLAAAVALRVLEQVADGAAQQPLVAVDVDAAGAFDVGADACRLLGGDREAGRPLSWWSGFSATSSRLASRTSSTRPSSSATFLSISRLSVSRSAGVASASIDTAIFMRASGERSSWLALASSERCDWTSASTRAAAMLKLAATAATSSAPEIATRWSSAPRRTARRRA
jgi:hypothetical protein